MHVDGFGVSDEVDAPDLFQQLIAAPDTLWVAHQQFQNLVFLGGKVEILSVPRHPAFLAVKTEVGVFYDVIPVRGFGAHSLGAAQQGAASGHQLPEPEWFDQIVIGTHLEAEDSIGFAVPGADDKDRGGVIELPELAAEVEPTHPRKHQIKDQCINAVGLRSGEHGQGFVPIPAGAHLKTLGTERFLHCFSDGGVVFNHQKVSSADAVAAVVVGFAAGGC